VYEGFIRSILPHKSAAIWALKSSDNARKTFVRSPCNNVRQDSPDKLDRSELMLCVATIGIQRACRAREKNFSSPDGSF
jgi:hypothetical protein